MAGEEAVQITATAAQKSLEVSVEIIKAIGLPQLKAIGNFGKKEVKRAADKISEKISEKTKSGNVSRADLMNECAKSNSAILSRSNMFAEDVSKIAARAKEEGIPIHIIGNGGRQTIEFLSRDKNVVEQIMCETIKANIKENPSEYKHFAIANEYNAMAMKELLEKNGVQCCMSVDGNGKTYCTYHAYDSEKVASLKQDFKDMRNDLITDLKVERSAEGLGTITDVKAGKTVDLSQFGGNVRQYQIVNALQKEFGYSKEKAMLAANKICDDLGLPQKEFYAHTEQLDNIKSFKTNIRFESDDRLLQNISFSEVFFQNGENPLISITNGENSITITPDKMSRDEIKEIFINELGMGEQQAEKAVDKTLKINDQINAKYKDISVDRTTGITQTIEIDRTSDQSFTLTVGNFKKEYNLNDKNVAENIAKDLGISSDKAKRIVGKAQQQSAFMNNLNKKSQNAKEKKKQTRNLHTEQHSKGVRK